MSVSLEYCQLYHCTVSVVVQNFSYNSYKPDTKYFQVVGIFLWRKKAVISLYNDTLHAFLLLSCTIQLYRFWSDKRVWPQMTAKTSEYCRRHRFCCWSTLCEWKTKSVYYLLILLLSTASNSEPRYSSLREQVMGKAASQSRIAYR